MWLPLAGEKWIESPPAITSFDSLHVRFNMITQNYIQTVFRYNDGHLYWLGNRRGAPKNKPVGSKVGENYLGCMLDGKHYLLHRLIYLYIHGYMPKFVDHINGNKTDNRIENLRDVTASGNQQNMRQAYVTNKSNLLGAFYSTQTKKWFSRICVNNKKLWLGTFDSPEKAHQAYIKAKRELHITCTI